MVSPKCLVCQEDIRGKCSRHSLQGTSKEAHLYVDALESYIKSKRLSFTAAELVAGVQGQSWAGASVFVVTHQSQLIAQISWKHQPNTRLFGWCFHEIWTWIFLATQAFIVSLKPINYHHGSRNAGPLHQKCERYALVWPARPSQQVPRGEEGKGWSSIHSD